MISIATDEAVQMLEAGWTVHYSKGFDAIMWRTPWGVAGPEYLSDSLDNPPKAALRDARQAGHIIHRPRIPSPPPNRETRDGDPVARVVTGYQPQSDKDPGPPPDVGSSVNPPDK